MSQVVKIGKTQERSISEVNEVEEVLVYVIQHVAVDLVSELKRGDEAMEVVVEVPRWC